MALDLFRISLGLQIEDAENSDELGAILSGAGAPGGDAAEQDASPIGSIFLRTDASSTISAVYQKIANAGAPADWVESASKDYVDNLVNGLSWREPALVRDGTAYADITAAETAANVGDTVDGVTIAAGDRLLFTNIANYETIAGQDETNFDGAGNNGTFVAGTGYAISDTITLSDGSVITVDNVAAGVVTEFTVTSVSTTPFSVGDVLTQGATSGTGTGFTLTPNSDNIVPDANPDLNNVYIVSGSSGAWTFTQDTNTATDGDALLVQEGTSADQQWVYDGTQWILFSSTAGAAELGFIRAFIGKDAAGSEFPNYSSALNITQNSSLETAIGELDAVIGDRTYTEQNFITNGQTIAASLDALDQAIADNSVPSVTATGLTGAYQTIDTVLVDDFDAVKWFVSSFDEGNPEVKEAVEIYAVHDGTAAADATDVDFNRSSRLQVSGGIAGNYQVRVIVEGTGAAQTMSLQVRSGTATVTTKARRLDVAPAP